MKKQRSPQLLCVSVFSISSGAILLIISPVIFNYLLKTINILNKDIYNVWENFPIKIPMDFYVFNWTNPEEIYEGVKPKFREMGPFRFSEKRSKVDVVWNKNGTVTFRQLRWWFSENDRLDENFTTIDPVALSAAHVASKWNPLMKTMFSMPFHNIVDKMHTTRTVRETLFDGYSEILITLGKNLPFLDKSSLPPWDKFAWFYAKNGSKSYDGVFNMGSGANDDFGVLYEWNYHNKTPYFPDSCGKVQGSAGEFFKPHQEKTSIKLFVPDLCRSLELDYLEEVMVGNIMGYKYTVSSSLDNGTKTENNQCFCNGECVPAGTLNVSSCKFGTPSFASLPHFYNADPYYVGLVDGLDPDRGHHEFYIILEPTTGLPLEVVGRLQINLLLQPIPGIRLYENIPKVYFPVLWFEQKLRLPKDAACRLYLFLHSSFILASLGVVLICIGTVMACYVVYKVMTSNKYETTFPAELRIPLTKPRKGKL